MRSVHNLARKSCNLKGAQVAVFFLLMKVTASSSDPTSLTATTTQCKEIFFNKKLSDHFTEDVKQARQRLSKLRAEALAFELAAWTPTFKSCAPQYRALAAIAANKAAAQQEAIAKHEEVLLEAALTLRERNGNLKALLQIGPTDYSLKEGSDFGGGTAIRGGSTGVLHGTPSNEKSCKTGLVNTKTEQAICDSEWQTPGDTSKAAEQIQQLTATPTTPDTEFAPLDVELDIRLIGKADSIGASEVYGPGACANTGTTLKGDVDHGIGLAPPGRHAAIQRPAETELHTKAGGTTKCVEQQNTDKLIVTAAGTAAAVCRGKEAAMLLEKTVADSTLADLTAQPYVQNIVFLIQKGAVNQGDSGPSKEAAAKAFFGGPTVDISKEYIKPLSTEKVSYKIGETETRESIEALSESENIGCALAVAFRDLKSKAEAAVDPSKKKESEDKTEEKKDGDNTGKPVCSSLLNQKADEGENQGGTKHCRWKGENSDGSYK
uniref:Variant surface glycoprotein 1125.4231 n=1 Tax=Trypanosoma brucei TaxID=5691 RepID=A0A1J0RAD0_9TRYP|nr:variant surface glycoprotein 1125.4231 [Trypanosoma brucei]